MAYRIKLSGNHVMKLDGSAMERQVSGGSEILVEDPRGYNAKCVVLDADVHHTGPLPASTSKTFLFDERRAFALNNRESIEPRGA